MDHTARWLTYENKVAAMRAQLADLHDVTTAARYSPWTSDSPTNP